MKGILPSAPQNSFEDLFSGRALAQMAKVLSRQSPLARRVFSKFKQKGKVTGFSVTRALLSNNKKAKEMAMILLRNLAENGAAGIEALTKGKGFKPNWSSQERNYWRNLDIVIIGGGVSEGKTGKVLVNLIKRYLSKAGLTNLKVYQAKFPGKEAGFIGGMINILELICNEAKKKGLRKIAVIGLDLGREEIGTGLLAINSNSGGISIRQKTHPWLFKHSVKTACSHELKPFLDSRQDYTKKEKARGEYIRALILKQMVDLIILTQAKAGKLGLECSRNIAAAVPGCTSGGWIIDSTDYLPFFRKQDGFHFSQALEELLVNRGMNDCRTHIINDGIAAGIANAYFNPFKLRGAKFAFFGVGSGLGGCVGVGGKR